MYIRDRVSKNVQLHLETRTEQEVKNVQLNFKTCVLWVKNMSKMYNLIYKHMYGSL